MEISQGLGWAGLLTFCLAMVRMMNGRLKNKVSRFECHTAQEGTSKRIDSLEKHMDDKFDWLKDFIKNGDK